ncbi:hypothetical protein ACO0LO_18910 [Undibacterium sp. TJN25]|uniref:hypothetical protein n=1 Tax=Undibacterium sp. TJN25 TaxID=3413056 RepID=UPI003BF3D85F
MKLSRPSRLVAAFIALFSMLFMQLAVASYACPGMTAGGAHAGASASVHATAAVATMAATTDMAGMMNCDGMDMEQPTLCHAYAQDSFSKQSLDKPQLPDVQPFLTAGLVLALNIVDTARLPQSSWLPSSTLARSTAPPIAIRNCCFRI